MDKARLGQTSQLLTVEELYKKYGPHFAEKHIKISCPLCNRSVFPHGAHSITVKSSFHHYIGATDCPYSRTNDERYAWLTPREVDLEAGVSLKKQVFEDENLRQIYAFCHYLCGKSSFPTEKFCELISIADKKNIWVYKDLPIWVVGFILMTLNDFDKDKNKSSYSYRFVFEKDKPKTVEDLWKKEGFYLLARVFGDSGRLMNYPPENPFTICRETFEELSQDQGWIQTSHLISLRKCGPKCGPIR